MVSVINRLKEPKSRLMISDCSPFFSCFWGCKGVLGLLMLWVSLQKDVMEESASLHSNEEREGACMSMCSCS